MPATIVVVIGYFVLYFSTKVQGTVHKIGRGLALWIFFLALFSPMMGAYVTISGQCPMEEMIEEIKHKAEQ
jgi:predicted membrane protein